jgi:hypothetical protein
MGVTKGANMVVVVNTQHIDNRQDPLLEKVEFVYWKFKGGSTYYVFGTDHRPANAVAKVQWEISPSKPDKYLGYLESVTDWVVYPNDTKVIDLDNLPSGRVFNLDDTDPVKYLMTQAYGDNVPA